jgi:hypothetical protein
MSAISGLVVLGSLTWRSRLRGPCHSGTQEANVKRSANDNGEVGTENAAERWLEDNEEPDRCLFPEQGPILEKGIGAPRKRDSPRSS